MRILWPWSKIPESYEPAPSNEALAALNQSQANLLKAEERWPDILSVSRSLRQLRRENHFSESIAMSMRPKKKD